MLRIVALAVVLAAPAAGPSGSARVVVEGLTSDAGAVRVALFDSEATFTRDAARAAILPISDGRAVWLLDDLAPGHYAVAAFHDEDGDGDTDRGIFGIPREPYGFSRGARGRFGAPAWQAARFRVGGGRVTVRVPVR